MLAGACDYAEAEAEAYAGAAHRSDSKRLAGAGRAVSEYSYHSGRCKGEEYEYLTIPSFYSLVEEKGGVSVRPDRFRL